MAPASRTERLAHRRFVSWFVQEPRQVRKVQDDEYDFQPVSDAVSSRAGAASRRTLRGLGGLLQCIASVRNFERTERLVSLAYTRLV